MSPRPSRAGGKPPAAMTILGVTGSIGMGKSTIVTMLRRLAVPVDDADRTVHHLLATDAELIAAIATAFPGTVHVGKVDRQALGTSVFGDPAARRRLEAMIHPRVAAARDRFLDRQARARAPLVALDIPLLFETGGEILVDATLVVTAPPFLQRQRVLSRPDMTEARFNAISAAQMPDAEKRCRADYLVFTGLSKHYTLRSVARIVKSLRLQNNARSRPRY